MSWRTASTKPEEAARPACPTELAARRVVRKAAVDRQRMGADEAGPSPLAQKPRSSICIMQITG